ncbi:hypothetical protein RE474_01650 [Methanolobus sediminis]|uniref:Uncharacterized protein n=1 Tax=Methanolobus sediminis TaxID=3072978 RepID=A0AA51YM05_9EURY|nr:hypothetical protein [Methanolobus sediminis]WMW25452.1 hypothetical protein RE474_01650 [Methanolobus sediminis]
MNLKNNYKHTLIILVIISILFVAMFCAISAYHRTSGYSSEIPIRPWNIIDPQSEYGIELTYIAEKAIEKECFDTNYISIQNIVQYAPNAPNAAMLKFQSAKVLSSAKIYSCEDFADTGTITFFEPDLDVYDVYNYHMGIYENHLLENRRKYSKNVSGTIQKSGWGKDYNYRINGDSIELIDPVTNDIVFILPDYEVILKENRNSTITEKINSEYPFAQQLLPVDEEKPYAVIDVTQETKESWLVLDACFDEEELYLLHTGEITQDIYNVVISHTVRYYDEEETVEK